MCERTTMPRPSLTSRPSRACVRSFPGRREQVRHARAFIAFFLDGWSVRGRRGAINQRAGGERLRAQRQ
jgi:hypothetical protein